MSKNGSNKGTYIFWDGILVVVAIILLVIFLPRTSANAPFVRINTTVITLEKTDANNKTINYYIENIIADTETNQSNKTAVQSLFNIQNALQKSNDFCLTALLFTTPQDGFNALAKKQNTYATESQKLLNEFHTYCATFITPFFIGTPDNNREFRLNKTLETFVDKYTQVMLELSAFYQTTAQIISDFSTPCMEVNPDMKERHLTLTTSAHTMIADENFALLNTATLLADATAIYAQGYYTTFI